MEEERIAQLRAATVAFYAQIDRLLDPPAAKTIKAQVTRAIKRHALGHQEAAPKRKTPKPAQMPLWWNDTVDAAWQAFCAMRTKKRAPLTDEAVRLIFRDLENWTSKEPNPAAAAADILTRSTRKSWTDIYQPTGRAATTKESASQRLARLKSQKP